MTSSTNNLVDFSQVVRRIVWQNELKGLPVQGDFKMFLNTLGREAGFLVRFKEITGVVSRGDHINLSSEDQQSLQWAEQHVDSWDSMTKDMDNLEKIASAELYYTENARRTSAGQEPP